MKALVYDRPGMKAWEVGRIANIGVHGKPVTLHLERLWTRDVTITTGLVDTYSIPVLLRLLISKQIDAQRFTTHRFGFDQFMYGLRRVRRRRPHRSS